MTEYWTTYQQYEAEGWPDWAAVTSIDQMSELVIDWLQGKTPFLPWHAGPPDDETSLIRSQLVALNRMTGIVTDNSPPGLETARWRQRAWVSGYATPETLTDLTDRARKQGLAVRTIAQIAPDDPIIAVDSQCPSRSFHLRTSTTIQPIATP